MAADVSMLIKDNNTKSGLITRDFLGGCFGIDSKELDLDLHVPNGWEKRLDLKSGKVYIQRSNPANSASEHKKMAKEISTKPQDLNVSSSKSSPSPSNSLSLSIGEEERESSRLSNSLPSDNQNKGLLVAAACPACLLYVLISKNDPKCPKCNSVVHLPTMNKKPKIDLNMSM
uniref:GIR1-like zinc ribbon domain-containing protein n=1 Tax=Chenopodium quinoa TaxID=63459 RepID=A0A803LPC9_CHEQI